jgi:hypothetical protein
MSSYKSAGIKLSKARQARFSYSRSTETRFSSSRMFEIHHFVIHEMIFYFTLARAQGPNMRAMKSGALATGKEGAASVER